MRRLRAAILRWYLTNRRDLPWRRTRDPYAVWVSEIMLQQTRVETAVSYYERFLARFPTVAALARAREADVLAAWSGLGYYRRARNLRDAAAFLVRERNGVVPGDLDSLRALPGVGDYTAAAIASVAFDSPAAAVDGNVVRVLARIHGLRGRRDEPALRREVRRIAERLAPGPRPGDWTQALMELGATVCLPRAPRCGTCPAARACAARAAGAPDRFPEGARSRRPTPERRVLLLLRNGNRFLLVPDGPARDAWTLPGARVGPRSGSRSAARSAARALGLPPASLRGPVASFRHRTFSHDVSFDVWEAVAGSAPIGDFRWIRSGAAGAVPLRAPTLKALRAVVGSRPTGRTGPGRARSGVPAAGRAGPRRPDLRA